MKKLLLVLLVTIIVTGVTCALYFRHEMAASQPLDELQWLKQEYALTDAQFAAIQKLHRDYRPICDAHCAEYVQAHEKLANLLVSNSQWSPEVSPALESLYRIQMECRRDMLKHAYQVSAVMSPEQGRRYMEMIVSTLSLSISQDMRPPAR